MALTPRSIINKLAPLIGTVVGGPVGALLGAVASTATAPLGEKDPNTGERVGKSLLTSKTMQGGGLLVVIPTLVFPLVDDAMGPPWSAWVKLILMVAAFAWLTYGRKEATKMPLGKT